MVNVKAHYVNGRVVDGTGDVMNIMNPASGEVVGEYREIGPTQIVDAIRYAGNAQQIWWSVGPQERRRTLLAAAELVKARSEELFECEGLQTGKLAVAVKADVDAVYEMFVYYAGMTEVAVKGEIEWLNDNMCQVVYRPYGIVALITPYNAPLFTAAWQGVLGLCAGNAVIIKPSENTPSSAVVLGECVTEAGAPEGLLSVVSGRGESIGEMLVGASEVRKVSFVGSVSAGRRVAEVAGSRGVSTILELGGQNCGVIFDDASIGSAVDAILQGAFGNAGQSCTAISFCLVQRGCYHEVISLIEKKVSGLVVGNPNRVDVGMGPVGRVDRVVAMRKLIDKAREAGWRIVAEGVVEANDNGYYCAPTVIEMKKEQFAWPAQEVFGPLLFVTEFDTETTAVQMINGSRFGLACAVFSASHETICAMREQVNVGVMWINKCRIVDWRVPFGGLKDSGFGRSSGSVGMKEYVQSMVIW